MAACPPLTLEVPDGGIGRASIECSSSTPDELHTLELTVSRSWVDLYVGTTDGGGEVFQARWGVSYRRLQPGVHVISFTPGAAAFWITIQRDAEGLAAVTDMQFSGVEQDLVLQTPWQEEDLRSLRTAQSRDVRWWWHYGHAPRALVRYANDSWGLIAWQVDDGPFMGAGDSNITLTPAARSGTDVAMVANRSLFLEGHVGALFQLTHLGQRVEEVITGEDQWSEAIRVTGVDDARKFLAQITGTFTATVTLQQSVGTDYDWSDTTHSWSGVLAATSIDDEYDNAVMYYRIGVKAGNFTSGSLGVALTYASGFTVGVARVVGYTDDKNVTVDVLTPFAAASATRLWQEGAWSGVRGWPAAGDLFDGRLWLGSVLNVFASTPDGFNSFPVSADDSGAISRSIAIGDAAPIRWIKGGFRLQIGTDSAVANIDAVRIGDAGTMQIRSSAFDEPITPLNMTIRELSTKIVFVDASGTRLNRLAYDLDTNSFVSENLNRLNEAIGFQGGGFIDLAYQARPQGRLHVPRADGQQAVLALAEAEAVVGWSRLTVGYGSLYAANLREQEEPEADDVAAAVESVCATPGVDGTADADQDFVHRIVWRQINGRQVRFHERIERDRWTDLANACHLEAAVRYEGPPARYLYGLDHLFGEEVLVWDGAQHGPLEVVDLSTLDDSFVDGEIGIDLGEGVTTEAAWIGLAMRTRYLSGKLPYGAQAGSAVGEKKKVTHVTVLFHETALGGVSVGILDGALCKPENPGRPFDEQAELMVPILSVADLHPDFAVDDPTELFSGELELTLPSSIMRDPRVAFEIVGAGPAAILGYIVNMSTNERP